MLPQTQTQPLTPHHLPSILPTSNFSNPISFSTTLSSTKLLKTPNFSPSKKTPFLKSSFHPLRCSISVVAKPNQTVLQRKPSPAEVSRTIVELSTMGTLSTLTQDGWPIGNGVRFAIDADGTPVMCLNEGNMRLSVDRKSSLNVQLEQYRSRTTQCTLQGTLTKPEGTTVLKKLHSTWSKRFGEEVDEDLIYTIDVERVLQMEDFKEEGIWVTSSEYKNANPDPLRGFAEKIVDDINSNHMEDFERICNIYADLEFQVTNAKLIWVDRLGFDVHLHSSRKEIFEVRFPFPREVADEKGVKSSFNCMAQLAWEVEKSYSLPDFEKGKLMKQIK